MGVDIADLGTERLTYRRLSVLLGNLPRDSAFVRSVAGEAATWSDSDHLLATITDLLASANWQRGGGKGKRPQPIPRPGKGVKRIVGDNVMDIDQAREWAKRQREGE